MTDGTLRGTQPVRVISGTVGREKIHFEAPPRDRLKKELDQFIAWFNSPPEGLDGLARGGIAHLWFVTLHPFADGNGRLARAITDMALCQDEDQPLRLFSLSAEIMRKRDACYGVLERTQRNDIDITLWLRWFLEQVGDACDSAEATVGCELADLVEKGCPAPIGGGRSAGYAVRWG